MSGYGKDVAVVTGGAGFIGSQLAMRLSEQGQRVRVLDDFSTGRRINLKGCGDNVDVAEVNLAEEPGALESLLADADAVYHLAARPSVAESMRDPEASVRNDFMATSNVLCAARSAGARRVIFTSSCAVYGNGHARDLHGGMLRDYLIPTPTSPYAAAKLCGEVLCRSFSRAFGLGTAVLRLYNVYGPGQPSDGAYAGVIPRFAEAMLAGKRPTIYGDGHQSRDFVHVDDVVDMLIAVGGERWGREGTSLTDVGSGSGTSILALVAILNDLLGTSIEPEFAPAREGEVRHSLADPALGFICAKTPLEEGLSGVLDWQRERLA